MINYETNLSSIEETQKYWKPFICYTGKDDLSKVYFNLNSNKF